MIFPANASRKGSITVGIDATSMFDVEDDDSTVYLCIPTISASSYSLGYNFRIPLPPLKDFWVSRPDEDGESEEETPKGNDLETEQGLNPILSINASLGGKLRHQSQPIQIENEETGEVEYAQVTLRSQIYSKGHTR